MSNIANFAGLWFPDKKVALVKKITEKTREGKIVWQKTTNGAIAHVPGALRMNFVEAPWSGVFMNRWVIFAVRDEVGSELLKVENQSSVVPGLALPERLPSNPSILDTIFAAGDPLVSAVTELHSIVQSQEGKEGVDRAIDILDKM